MAPSLRNFRTETLINVSQNYTTPPPRFYQGDDELYSLTPPKTTTYEKLRSFGRVPYELYEDSSNKLQTSVDGLNKTVGRQTQLITPQVSHSAHMSSSPKIRAPDRAKKPLENTASDATSAAAALRARRETVRHAAEEKSEQNGSLLASSFSNLNNAPIGLEVDTKHVQNPAQVRTLDSQPQQRHTTGKLPSAKGRMSVRTPIASKCAVVAAKKTIQMRQTRKAAAEVPITSSTISFDEVGYQKANRSPQKEKEVSRKSATDRGQAVTKRIGTYDVPISSSPETPHQTGRKREPNKITAAKKAVGSSLNPRRPPRPPRQRIHAKATTKKTKADNISFGDLPTMSSPVTEVLADQDKQPTSVDFIAPLQDHSRCDMQGSSKENAIVLSDQPQSTSPILSTPRKEDNFPFPDIQGPTRLPSSPPVADRQNNLQLSAQLMNTEQALRPTIITFDERGPCNQRSLSPKKVVPSSAWTNRSSMPSKTTVQLGSGRPNSSRELQLKQKTPPSRPSSNESTGTVGFQTFANVANSVPDALANLMKKQSHLKQVRSTPILPDAIQPTPKPNTSPLENTEVEKVSLNDFKGTSHEKVRTGVDFAAVSSTTRPCLEQNLTTMQKPIETFHTLPTSKLKDIRKSTQHATNIAGQGSAKRNRDSESSVLPKPKRVNQNDDTRSEDVRSWSEKRMLDKVAAVSPTSIVSCSPNKMASMLSKEILCIPSRLASHGSQKVDRRGSPVPLGMTVPEKSTVLDTYFQQAGISSDSEVVGAVFKPTSPLANNLNPLEQDLLPSVQLEERPSAGEPLSFDSGDDSQVITGNPRTDLNQRLTANQLEASRNERSQGTSDTNFIEQLRRTTEMASMQPTRITEAQAPSDEPEKNAIKPEHRWDKTRRMRSDSTDISSESSADTDDSTGRLHDIAMWRSGLQPHQMDLFDELVNISHRLTRFLIYKDTTTSDIVDDYYRRGQNLVEQMERSHTEYHRKYIDTLNERKKQLQKEFGACSKKVKECVSAVEGLREESKTRNMKEDVLGEKLKTIIAEFC